MALTKVIGDGLGSTNDLTVDTTTLTVDATNNRVGIGTASPSEVLHVNSGSGNIGIRVESTDSLALAAFKDNSTSDVVLAGASGDNLAVSHDILFTNASKGVYLGVTSATASNLLDDYEEGTWTPVFSGAGSPSHTVQFGSYTKVGRLVHITIAMRASSVSSSDTIKITGLPFASADSGDSQQRSTLDLSNCGHLVGLSVASGRFRTSGSELHGVKDVTSDTSFMTASQMSSGGSIEFAGAFTYYTS